MDKEQRAQVREANRIKNQRRRTAKQRTTTYAQRGREERRRANGAFGKEDPATFNVLAEGTTAVRKAETDG